MICSAEALSYKVSAKITASSGINCVMGHKKSEVMVKVDSGNCNSALTTAAKQPSTVSSVGLGECKDQAVARLCVRIDSMSMLVCKKRN